MSPPLLEVRDLVKRFESRAGWRTKRVVHAVDGVSFEVFEGETLGLVGESGCGKSTLGRCILRLYDLTSGSVLLDGEDISRLRERQLRPYRRQMQMVFQDPFSSLNPRKPVGTILGDVFRVHGLHRTMDVEAEIGALLDKVGLPPDAGRRYPRQFSGGQRQRVGLARALALRPRLVIADEPVSALDVSVQAQVVNLLDDLQEAFGLTYIVIAHDLGLVRHIADRIGVMYLGKLVELGTNADVYARPVHPYTQALLSAVPIPDPAANDARERIELQGELPSPSDPPSGCRFHTRCPYATEICRQVVPPLVDHGGGRLAACHHPLNVGPDAGPDPAVVPVTAHDEHPGDESRRQ